MLTFGIIFNPSNLLLKYEVWVKGDSTTVDTLGQPLERQQFCQKACSFPTIKGAEKFVKYQQETRQFRGVVA